MINSIIYLDEAKMYSMPVKLSTSFHKEIT
jgi:hypothetical protein